MTDDEMLDRLGNWLAQRADGDWEHRKGIRIESIDNPGWSLVVELGDEVATWTPFTRISIDRGRNDWLSCQVVDDTFQGASGASNLKELVSAFIDWAEENSQDS